MYLKKIVVKRRKIFISIICLLFLAVDISRGEEQINIDDPKARYGGISIVQTNRGSGLGGFYEIAKSPSNRLGINIDFIMVRGEYDYPITVWDPYYGYMTYERSDKKRLSLLPVYAVYKRMFFVDKIANNFRPFLSVSLGPIVGIDPPNVPDFSDRMKGMQFPVTFGARVGAGVDFIYGPGTLVSLFVGYDVIKFSKRIDASTLDEEPSEDWIPPSDFYGSKDYSTLIIELRFGKRY
jgi:hypothetical protein